MRRFLAPVAALVLALALAPPVWAATPGTEARVTGQTFIRHDGGSDQGIEECNDEGSDATAVDPADGDADPNDGGARRQGNEPYSVVDPTDPDFIVAGWNDYCLTDLNAGWEGFGFSEDGGQSWTNSFVPGYPQDTSEEGMVSPLFGKQRFAGDPIAAFDSEGNLFVGGIAFNRAGAINGDVFVATYGTEPTDDFPVDYLRTVVVGRGTPSRNFQGIFQDKPMLEVDRTGSPDTDGNVYVCWSRFTGFGNNKVQFSRSTDGGETFSKPVFLSGGPQMRAVQGCDIAVENDGDVYVTWRTFSSPSATAVNGLAFARSDDGGASFSKPELIREITPYFPFDGSRDCGDGPLECPSGFVFARIPLEPRVTSDQSGELGGVYLAYNEVDPGSIVDAESTYTSAGNPGAGEVGRSLVYVIGTTDDGESWSDPLAVDPGEGVGHQFFPDIDAFGGQLGVVWQDSRTDGCYDVQRPMGNTEDATACGDSNVVNTFASFSADGGSFGPSVQLSTVGHQPQYEMFGNRDIPFQGDYNWISIAPDGSGGLFAYASWTDNRDVATGTDPREADDDGFDVHQCRELMEDDTYGPDTCPNAGGLDQEIYGSSINLP
ncbi:MAG TPA: sialidase family protein [Actinomycetota bacterium]|nr:sialidase family protein [Actinomycetota bacterium]